MKRRPQLAQKRASGGLAHLLGAHHQLGDARRAEAVGAEALELALETGDVRGAAIVRGNLATNLLVEGDDVGAARLLDEALEGHRAGGDVYGMAVTLANLATIALRAGDLDRAASHLIESLQLSKSIGDALNIGWELAIAAAVVLAQGDATASARLCGVVDALCSAHGFALDPADQQLLADTTGAARRTLGDAFEDAWAVGAELELDAAVELAIRRLVDVDRPAS